MMTAGVMVRPDSLSEHGRRVREIAQELRAAEARLRQIYDSLDWEVRSRGAFDARITAACHKASRLAEQGANLAALLNEAAEGYRETDRGGASRIVQSVAPYQQDLQDRLVSAKAAWWEAKIRGDQPGMDQAHSDATRLRDMGAVDTDTLNASINQQYARQIELQQLKRDWWVAWLKDDQAGMDRAHAAANDLRAKGTPELDEAGSSVALHDAMLGAVRMQAEARARGDSAAAHGMQAKVEHLESLGAVVTEEERSQIEEQVNAEIPAESAPAEGTVVVDVAALRAATTPAEKIAILQPVFEADQRKSGIPWEIKMAQWALETGWGAKTPVDLNTGQESFNLYGVKGEGPAGSVLAWTKEERNGVEVPEQHKFRAYHSLEESIADHSATLQQGLYAPARACGDDLKCWCDQLEKCGYATDSQYAEKLWNIIRINIRKGG